MKNDVLTNNNRSVTFLTIVVYFLLAFLTFFSGWQQLQINKCADKFDTLPEIFLLKERYLTEKLSMTKNLDERMDRIESKLDRLIERLPQTYNQGG